MSVRVLIVDDHRVFREGLRAVLHGRDGVEVVAEASDAASALAVVSGLAVDVVLMDVHLPGETGIDATRVIRRDHPEVAVLMLTMLDDSMSVEAAITAGARGYLVKTSGLDDILRGIHAVHAGQFLLGAGASGASRVHTGASPFTARERQVLELLAAGSTTGQISARLGISGKTVRNYLSILYAKLGVEDRGQAVLAAQRHIAASRVPETGADADARSRWST